MRWNLIRLSQENSQISDGLANPIQNDNNLQQNQQREIKNMKSEIKKLKESIKNKPIQKKYKQKLISTISNESDTKASLNYQKILDYSVFNSKINQNQRNNIFSSQGFQIKIEEGLQSKMQLKVQKVIRRANGNIYYVISGYSYNTVQFTRQNILSDKNLFTTVVNYYQSKGNHIRTILL